MPMKKWGRSMLHNQKLVLSSGAARRARCRAADCPIYLTMLNRRHERRRDCTRLQGCDGLRVLGQPALRRSLRPALARLQPVEIAGRS